MKPLRKHLKGIALFLAITFLLQSCKVYTYKATTVDAAVNKNYKKVKVKSNIDETYIFDKLEEKDGVHYGIALKDSKTAKKLFDQITNEDEFNYVKILLKEEQLNKVYVKKHDKILSIVIPISLLGGVIAIISDRVNHMTLN